jgi:hypothetical protein
MYVSDGSLLPIIPMRHAVLFCLQIIKTASAKKKKKKKEWEPLGK